MITNFRSVQEVLHSGKYPLAGTMTREQEDYVLSMLRNHVTFVDAKAGSGKTAYAVLLGVELVARKTVDKVIYIANPVQQETLGHLKGSLTDKIIPYMLPFFNALYGVAKVDRAYYPMELVCDFTEDTIYEATTPTFLRGTNIEKSFVIIDEVQNFSMHELKKIGTRLDDNCIVVLIGHSGQMDVKANQSGFTRYMSYFKDLQREGLFKNVAFCELTQNFRGSISKAFDDIN